VCSSDVNLLTTLVALNTSFVEINKYVLRLSPWGMTLQPSVPYTFELLEHMSTDAMAIHGVSQIA
jgi:hypothetical protein